VPDPTALLVVDEADRLKIAGLEQVRSIFDQAHLLQFATQSGGNLLIPHKAMPPAAKS
jgi:hypothetical protein